MELPIPSLSDRIADSRFWKPLWSSYHRTPSIALCRVPELEYASSLSWSGRALDHCCGDGQFAALAWPQVRFAAGCDFAFDALAAARSRNRHDRLDQADAGQQLPYADEEFDLVFNNSALEHIADLEACLREVARVTRRDGVFAFNVLNHRYFEWWPLEAAASEGYRAWQPFYHALSMGEWEARLAASRFTIESVQGYFDRSASRTLALLDCEFSGFYLKQRPSTLVAEYNSWTRRHKRRWQRELAALCWPTAPDAGAGYFIRARRT